MFKKIIFLSLISTGYLQANESFGGTTINETDHFSVEIDELFHKIKEKVKMTCKNRNMNQHTSREETKLHLKELVACEVLLNLFEDFKSDAHYRLNHADALRDREVYLECIKELLNLVDVVQKHAQSEIKPVQDEIVRDLEHTTDGRN